MKTRLVVYGPSGFYGECAQRAGLFHIS